MSDTLTALFLTAVLASTAIRLWLAGRQVRHVTANRAQVPSRFAGRIGLAAHQRAADYTVARVRLGVVDTVLGVVVLLALTLGGGVQQVHDLASPWLGNHPITLGVVIVGAVIAIGAVLDLPLAWYRQFRLERRFGFNRMTLGLFIADMIKGTLLGAALGLPLLALVLWLMRSAGDGWWLWTWLVWMAFNLVLLVAYPTLIAPLFNRFVPLADGGVKQRIEALLARCGFTNRGLFVMDGSRRSSHGNAYFTGLGRAKRIVFFDTLIERLAPAEIEAVLAHELGHFKRRHVTKRIVASGIGSLAGLWVLGQLSQQAWFFEGLGVPASGDAREAIALLLFLLVTPSFTFLARPLLAWWSRRHEFEADRFAAEHAEADDLIAALVKLYEDNASTLTPDPLHSAFYDSHPPALERIDMLARAAAPRAAAA